MLAQQLLALAPVHRRSLAERMHGAEQQDAVAPVLFLDPAVEQPANRPADGVGQVSQLARRRSRAPSGDVESVDVVVLR